MPSEFDFELSQPRRRVGRWVCMFAGVVLLIGLPAGHAWTSHVRMLDAEAQLRLLRAEAAAALAPQTKVLPPYYAQARQALALLNWPFDEGLRELEHCIPDGGRLKALHVDVQREELTTSLEILDGVQSFRVDELMVCLNGGRKGWKVVRIGAVEVQGAPALSIELNRHASFQ